MFWQAEFSSIAPRRPATPRIRKPTLETDRPGKDVGVSREPRPGASTTTTTIAPLEDEEETAEINDEELQCQPCGMEPLKAAPSPILPPATGIEEHRLTHWPYRSWCEFCNVGRGIGEQHRRSPGKPRSIAIVGLN